MKFDLDEHLTRRDFFISVIKSKNRGEFFLYAVNLNLKNRMCIVLGGGRVAYRKILPLLKSEAVVKVIAPEVCDEILELIHSEKIYWIREKYSRENLQRGFLFFAATNDPAVNDRASYQAKLLGMLVNNATNPNDSDFAVPATIKRENFSVAVTTDNISPAFSRFARQKIEKIFPESTSEFLQRLEKIRNDVKLKIPNINDRKKFWRMVFETHGDQILQLIQTNEIDKSEEILTNALDSFRIESSHSNN